METRHDVCVSLDRRTLEMLRLMEDRVRAQLNVETYSKSATMHMAKSRYIMGQRAVSALRLPTENSPEFRALRTVDRDRVAVDGVDSDRYSADAKRHVPDSDRVNPMRWFGVLVPQDLHRAQDLYASIVEHVVESLNLQKRLEAVCDEIKRLFVLKDKYSPEE